MKRELFIYSINLMEMQSRLDISISKHFGMAFPDAFEANLLPRNHFLQEALIHILEYAMNDESGWINYFIWELDFGRKNDHLKVMSGGVEIPMSNAGELYDMLLHMKSHK